MSLHRHASRRQSRHRHRIRSRPRPRLRRRTRPTGRIRRGQRRRCRRSPPTRSPRSRPRAARPSPSSLRSARPRPRKQLVQTAVDTYGRLDILVTNAGVLRDTVLWKMSDDDFDTVINVHLRGTFTCAREAATYMRENEIRGRIIAIGSPTGQRGNFGQTNYAAAKAGIVGMVRTWALELKRAGITANAVIPVAATAMTATVPYFAAAVEADAAGEPMPPFFRHDLGFGTSDDVAGLIAYLASDAAADVTGQAIGVGGDRIQVWSHPEPVVTRIATAAGRTTRSTTTSPRSSAAACSPSARSSRPLPEELQRPHRLRPRHVTLRTPRSTSTRSTAIDMHVHIEVDGARTLVPAGRSGRGGQPVLHHRRPAARPRLDRRLLPRAPHGRRRLHRRRRDAARPAGASRVPRSPRAPRATTTC